jgi:hypothetical protein
MSALPHAGGLVSLLWFVLRVLVHGWATLAILLEPAEPWMRTTLAIAFGIFGVWALWLTPAARAPCLRALLGALWSGGR